MKKRLNPLDAKKPVSISMTLGDLTILDNIASSMKTTRSAIVSQMIRAKGYKDLGLKATEKHVAPRQNWNGEKTRDLGACNPYHKDGKCKHHACQAVYRKEGV
tara:strand:- start:537 stop:845 length:309 start_codon:yes stop_codon:yes gene_type:complete